MASGPAVPANCAFRSGEKVEWEFLRLLGEMAIRTTRLANLSEGNLPESVHGTRVLIKRLRALLWFASPAFSAMVFDRAKSHLRKASHLLAAVRELAVMRAHLEGLARKTSKPADRKTLLRLAHAPDSHPVISARPNQSLRQAAEIVLTTIKELKKAANGIARWPSSSGRVATAFRAFEKAGKKALRGDDPARFHDWRKRTKRLLYLLQLTQGEPDDRLAKTIDRVDQLQDQLGAYHDAVIAQDRLRKYPPAEISQRLVRHGVRILEKRMRRLRKKVRKIARHLKRK